MGSVRAVEGEGAEEGGSEQTTDEEASDASKAAAPLLAKLRDLSN